MSMMFDDKVRSLPGAKRVQAACFACAVVNALLVVGQTVAIACALSGLWGGGTLGDQVLALAAFAACWCARVACSHIRGRFTDRFAGRAAGDLRTRALQSIYDQGPSVVAHYGSASIITTLLEGTDQVRAYIALSMPKTADLVSYTVVLAAALLWVDPISGVIALAVVPCTIFFMRLLGGYAKDNAAGQFAAYRRLANRFADSLRGMSVLAAFGAQDAQAEAVFRSSEELRLSTMRTLKTATLNSLVLDLFRVFALAAVAIMLGFRLMAGGISLFSALVALMIVPELFGALRRWANDFHASLDGRSQLSALLDLIARPAEPACDRYQFFKGNAPELEFYHVSFRYPPNVDAPGPGECDADATVPLQLDDVSFDVAGPLRVGIVGPSGAGKTTLARIIAGFASPCSGEVKVNGASGATLACESWRDRVAYLPQNPHLFNATLRDNISFYRPDAPESDVAAAVRAAGLASLVDELPLGLDTVIGEGGRALSGGQAQRVALARVLLDGNRDVVVFDEPTAHLDIETELTLKGDMLSLMEGKLVFFATHRLHWMRNMDLILVLEGGAIVQAGDYEELAGKPGPFSALVADVRGDAA